MRDPCWATPEVTVSFLHWRPNGALDRHTGLRFIIPKVAGSRIEYGAGVSRTNILADKDVFRGQSAILSAAAQVTAR
jgi:hypothetical protein